MFPTLWSLLGNWSFLSILTELFFNGPFPSVEAHFLSTTEGGGVCFTRGVLSVVILLLFLLLETALVRKAFLDELILLGEEDL